MLYFWLNSNSDELLPFDFDKIRLQLEFLRHIAVNSTAFKIKIKLNFYHHTSSWGLKGFMKALGLHKTC